MQLELPAYLSHRWEQSRGDLAKVDLETVTQASLSDCRCSDHFRQGVRLVPHLPTLADHPSHRCYARRTTKGVEDKTI